MQYNVPQFIDIEDHIVGPLTAKQLGWLTMGGVILLVLWGILDMSAFIIAAILIAPLFAALAFYQPSGQPLIKFVLSSVFFMFHPKVYVWKKFPGKTKIEKREKKIIKEAPKKILTKEKVEELSNILDK
jgi:hypothetical protein